MTCMMTTWAIAMKIRIRPLTRKKYQDRSSNPLDSGGRARPPPRLSIGLPSIEQGPQHEGGRRDERHDEGDDDAVKKLAMVKHRVIPEVDEDDAQTVERVVVKGRDEHDFHQPEAERVVDKQ